MTFRNLFGMIYKVIFYKWNKRLLLKIKNRRLIAKAFINLLWKFISNVRRMKSNKCFKTTDCFIKFMPKTFSH